MQCSKEFSIVVGPGVSWQNLFWTRDILVAFGDGTASFIPENQTSNKWVAATSGHGSTVAPDDRGQVQFRGTLVYAGPNRAGIARMEISNSVVGAFIINTLSLGFFINGILQTSVTMPAGFSGTLDLPFTASTGTLVFVFAQASASPFAAASNLGAIMCLGKVFNV